MGATSSTGMLTTRSLSSRPRRGGGAGARAPAPDAALAGEEAKRPRKKAEGLPEGGGTIMPATWEGRPDADADDEDEEEEVASLFSIFAARKSLMDASQGEACSSKRRDEKESKRHLWAQIPERAQPQSS